MKKNPCNRKYVHKYRRNKVKRKRKQATVSIMAGVMKQWSKDRQRHLYRKVGIRWVLLALIEGHQTHNNPETQPVQYKQHSSGEELAALLQGSSLMWQSSWRGRLRILAFIHTSAITTLTREGFADSCESEALVLDDDKQSFNYPFTSFTLTKSLISSPRQIFWEHNLIIFLKLQPRLQSFYFSFVLSS